MRQSPSSSRNRSTTRVRSLGTLPVASACSLDEAHEVAHRALVEADPLGDAGRIRRVRRGEGALEGADRPAELDRAAEPVARQNGTRPGSPNAGSTMTRSWVISWMRQLVAPRLNTSPTRDS